MVTQYCFSYELLVMSRQDARQTDDQACYSLTPFLSTYISNLFLQFNFDNPNAFVQYPS